MFGCEECEMRTQQLEKETPSSNLIGILSSYFLPHKVTHPSQEIIALFLID